MTYDEIVKDPGFKTLTSEERARVRSSFYKDFVENDIPEDKRESFKVQFFKDAEAFENETWSPKPSINDEKHDSVLGMVEHNLVAGIGDSLLGKGMKYALTKAGMEDDSSKRIETPKYSFEDVIKGNEVDGMSARKAALADTMYSVGKFGVDFAPISKFGEIS